MQFEVLGERRAAVDDLPVLRHVGLGQRRRMHFERRLADQFGLGAQAAAAHQRGIHAQIAAIAVLDEKRDIIEGIEQAFQGAQVDRAEW